MIEYDPNNTFFGIQNVDPIHGYEDYDVMNAGLRKVVYDHMNTNLSIQILIDVVEKQ